MIRAVPQQVGEDAGVARPPHLVVKRGHRGRFRFALITDEGRLTGEVTVEDDGADRDIARARAISKIASLAHSLSAALAMNNALPTQIIATHDFGQGGCLGEI